MIRKFEMPWRPAYESYAALGWAAAVFFLVIGTITENLPAGLVWYMSAVAFVFMVWNIKGAWRIWAVKFALCGVGIEFMKIAQLQKKVIAQPDQIWLGYGFEWKTEHAQRIYDLKKINPSDYYPPKALLHLKELLTSRKIAALDENGIGAPWIHGVEPNEQDVTMFIDNLIGNTLIVGTTRCGKTRMLDVLITQFTLRKDACVVCFDPKGDAELRENMRRAAKAAGRENDFSSFHIGFPMNSIRIDPLKSYIDLSELASRVVSLMPTEGGGMDAFTAFAWSTSNAIFLGLVETNEKPTLVKLRQYIESGVQTLLIETYKAYFTKTADRVSDWEKNANIFISRKRKRNAQGEIPSTPPNQNDILAGYAAMYEEKYKSAGFRSEAIEALSNINEHPADHLEKMLANFKPLLTMLTTGELGPLLSPDASNINDERLCTDLMSLTDGRGIIYIGLNSLANKTVASAVGSMLLSDLTAVAAARQNFRTKAVNDANKVYLVVDEAAQIVNDPYIQILNMSAGAGFVNIAATQTISDFSARLGNEDKARVMLGNFNNLFALRSKDRATQDFIIETFGKSSIYSLQTSKGTNSSTEQNITHFAGTISEKVGETLEDTFPADLLGKLPNWQYFASTSGGRLIKGRVPILMGEN